MSLNFGRYGFTDSCRGRNGSFGIGDGGDKDGFKDTGDNGDYG